MKAAIVGVLAVLLPAWGIGDDLTVTVERFGSVPVLRGGSEPAPVVLFVSGDAGISPNVRGMAEEIAGLGAVVAVVDIWRYLHALDRTGGTCTQPAPDCAALAQAVEQAAGYQAYQTPILAGFSSGATLVYAVLAEAPTGAFLGAISLGFCPDLPVKKPFCAGAGLETGPGPEGKGFSFLPAKHLGVPWVAFQGDRDEDCPAAATRDFVAQVHGAWVVEIPGSDHYFHDREAWIPKLGRVLDRMQAALTPQ
jgi:dienelactone hydrolase